MKPYKFRQATKCLTKPSDMTDSECVELWVYQDTGLASTLSCWKLTWRERLSAMLFGRVWLWVRSGGATQPPVALQAKRGLWKL
jgi:hypothetical protein